MKLNKKLPEYLLGKYQLIGTVTFSVLFAIVFLNIYIPFSETAWFGLGYSQTFLKTLLFIGVGIITLIISRMTMYHMKRLITLTYLDYIIWCLSEFLVIAAIYTWISAGIITLPESAFQFFIRAVICGSVALGVPYLISGMYFSINDKNKTIRLMSYENVVTDEEHVEEKALKKVTLFDNSGALKLALNLESLYYVESDDNYIKAWYTDNSGELKVYMIRCRLKTIEDNFRGTSLMRCHRQYIVNTDKVKIVRKNHDGFFLELDHDKISPIPVTKTYAANVTKQFSDKIETRS
jgi:hypothetical protein